MIKVSVIMPAYNVATYIEKSVNSIMNQTMSDLELVIVNDASTDQTWDKIVELKKVFGEKINAINLEKNVRQGGARNKGIREAKGEYIVFVDSDDWIEEDMIEKFYNSMVNFDAELVGTTSYYMFYSENNIKLCHRDNERLSLEISGKTVNKNIRDIYFLSIGGIWMNMYKRQVIVDNNIWFPEGVSYEDNYFVNLYLCYVKKYIWIDEAFYYYRQLGNSTVHKKDFSQLQRIQVEKLLLSELKKRGLFDDVKDGYEVMCIQRWYINTLGILYGLYGKSASQYAIPIGKEFKKYFPNYKNNKYYKKVILRKDRFKLLIFEFSPMLLRLMYIVYGMRKRPLIDE